MSKSGAASLLVLLFLVCFVLTQAERPAPVSEPHQLGATTVAATATAEAQDDVCNGVGEEECQMMRRELAAHLDYIYTQKKKN